MGVQRSARLQASRVQRTVVRYQRHGSNPPGLRNRVLTVHFMLITLVNINWWVSGELADRIGDRQALAAFDLYVLLFVWRLVLLGISGGNLEGSNVTLQTIWARCWSLTPSVEKY